MTPGGLGAVAAMDAPQFEGLRKVDGLRKVAAMDAPQFAQLRGVFTWRQAGDL